jgi:hypothetical protein
MASGQKTSLKYDYGICGECNYTIEEMVRDHPQGPGDLEATASLLALPNTNDHYLVVTPHRKTCSFHTKQEIPNAATVSSWEPGPEPQYTPTQGCI